MGFAICPFTNQRHRAGSTIAIAAAFLGARAIALAQVFQQGKRWVGIFEANRFPINRECELITNSVGHRCRPSKE